MVIVLTKQKKELKENFKIVDKYITEENIHSRFKHEFMPKKNNLT